MTRDFHYAESVTLGNGRRQIVLIAGRPPLKKGQSNPAENITRASEYPISAIELTVGPDGVGRGKSHDVARIKSIGKDGFVFEDYAGRPIELMDVKPR
jgi:hypothetical protein